MRFRFFMSSFAGFVVFLTSVFNPVSCFQRTQLWVDDGLAATGSAVLPLQRFAEDRSCRIVLATFTAGLNTARHKRPPGKEEMFVRQLLDASHYMDTLRYPA